MSADQHARTMLPIPDRPPGGSEPASQWSFRSTRPLTSATSPAPRSLLTTARRFTGKINWVQIDLGKDDHDHFIDLEERLRVAMSRQ
jgi:hypothetical protein